VTRKLPENQQKAFDNLYQGAMEKDGNRVRSALTDDFTFKGPLTSFDQPDIFVDAMIGIDATVTQSHIIADGNELAHSFILEVSAPFEATIPMCDIIEFENNLIKHIHLYTDSKLFP